MHAMRGKAELIGYTIYNRTTTDFPGWFVVRKWRTTPQGIEHAAIGCLCGSLVEARLCIPEDLACIFRELTDDPVIVESWI